ncbi:MAG: hypothetical protein HRU15_19285, partial [Planctomycetes bacterium]|nr:hypothetical protein [Planctomycetota bacterium]
MQLYDLCTDYQSNGFVASLAPRFFWKAESAQHGSQQTAWQIQVARSEQQLTADALSVKACLWDSAKVEAAENTHVMYDGAALRSGERCFLRLRIWDEAGVTSEWSEIQYFIPALVQEDWQASWIEAPEKYSSTLFKKSFSVDKKIASAYLYVSGQG